MHQLHSSSYQSPGNSYCEYLELQQEERVWGWGGNARCVSFSCLDCEYVEGKGCVLLISVPIAKHSTWHRAGAQ